MNDNDLERRLRAESGPREEGYLPSQLPATLESGRRPTATSRAVRLAMLVPAVVAGVAVVAVAAALLNGSGPDGVGAGATPTADALSDRARPVYCQPNDVGFTAEPWGGAAGSRGTVVTVASPTGRYPCLFAAVPGARIEDQGATLVGSETRGTNPTSVLESGTPAEFSSHLEQLVRRAASTPSTWWSLSGGIDVSPVDVPQGIGAMPPCMGENTPSTLSVTDLSPAP